MHICNICFVNKKSLKSLVRHCRVHQSNASFRCTIPDCKRIFKNYTTYTCHLSRDHSNKSKVLKNDKIDRGSIFELECPIIYCKQALKNPNDLKQHFKSHLDQGQEMPCSFVGCSNTFKSYSGFKSHNFKYHKNRNLVSESADITSENQHNSENNIHAEAAFDVNYEENNSDEDTVTHQEYVQYLATFYLKLQSKYLVPASTVQIIVDEINSLNALRKELIQPQLIKKLKDVGLEMSTINDICSVIMTEDPIYLAQAKGPLRSIHSRNNVYKNSFNLIEPLEIALGRNQSNELRSYFYIPILESLTVLLSDKFIIENFQTYSMPMSNPDLISDFNDGASYRKNDFFKVNPDAISIILYQDSFDLVNPLGAAKSKHKILAVYMILGNLPAYLRFKVDPMLLVLLSFEEDFKEFGSDKMFEILINDLKKLEKGVQLISGKHTTKGTLLFVLGDNLGSHIIGGFTENFSSSDYFCRYCFFRRKHLARKSQYLYNAKERTPENYAKAIQHLCSNKEKVIRHGVKRDSPFNQLAHFHVCNPSLPPCLGHDLFEGVVQYDVPLIVKKLIADQWFSVETVNVAMKSFPYKDYDATDKPPSFKTNMKKLGGHAAQNWCLVRNFPFFIFDKIEQDNDYWDLFQLLQELVEYACAPKLYEREIDYFEDVIEKYLEKRVKLFPHINLRPKHHYLRHYAWMYRQFGPLILVWTMRCESKHSYFKRCIRNSPNFKNVLLSLSTRHQMLQAYLRTGQLYGTSVEMANSIHFHKDAYSDKVQIAVSKMRFQSNENINVSHNVKFRGMTYKQGSIVILGIGKHVFSYEFGKIMFCLSRNDDIFIVTKTMSSKYVSNLRAYQVEDHIESTVVCTSTRNLLDHHPLPIYVLHGYSFVKLKHTIATPLPL